MSLENFVEHTFWVKVRTTENVHGIIS